MDGKIKPRFTANAIMKQSDIGYHFFYVISRANWEEDKSDFIKGKIFNISVYHN